jgi:hypothetical protein
MPYILNKTNGQVLATVQDGSINQSTSVTFVGKNYAGYGGFIDTNFLHLLENFANSNQPSKAITGQLWYDSTRKKLKVYDGANFVSIAYTSNTSNGSPPTNLTTGDLWFDQSQNLLNVYNGTQWVVIGPSASSSGASSSAIRAVTIKDSTENNHFVIPHTVSANSLDVVVAVTSAEDIAVNTATSFYSDFPTLRKGITLNGADANGISATGTGPGAGFYLWGTAATAFKLTNGTTNFGPGDFLLKTTYDQGIANGLIIDSDDGITVGVGRVFRFHADHGNEEGKITGINANKISFNLQYNSTTTNILIIDGNSLLPGVGGNVPPVYIGSAGRRFAALHATTVTSTSIVATNITATNYIGVTATFTTIQATTAFIQSLIGTRTITTGASGTTGTITGAWSLTGGSTLQATYADLAERYAADAVYDYGTVLVIGGDKEVTVTTERANIAVAGIVSQNPAYMMNSDAGNDKTHPYIALKGRVLCKVTGPVKKGDLLVTSNMAGVACAWKDGDDANAVIAKALESFVGPAGVIEVKV